MKFCPNCGKELPNYVAFCTGCGEKQPLQEISKTESADEKEISITTDDSFEAVDYAGKGENVSGTYQKNEFSEYVGKVCPYCKTEITSDDDITVCPACDIAHHKVCWDENGGCTTFGCSGKASGTIICYNCGADLTENQMFCVKCGAPRAVQESNGINNTVMFPIEVKPTNCANCGSPILLDQEFCSNCGFKLTQQAISSVTQNAFNAYNSTVVTKKRPIKGVLTGIAVAVVAFIVIVVGISISNNKAQKIEDYKIKAKKFSTICWTCGQNLEDVGNDIQTYWSEYVFGYGSKVYYSGHYMYSIDDAVSYALSDNSTTVSTIKVERSSIQKQYNQLKDVPDAEVNEIWNDIKNVYDAIEEMYDCVINVSGNYTTYKSAYSKCDTNLADALKSLDNDLD